MTEPTARRMWRALEAYHGFVYFVPEADEEFAAIGLDGYMMGYFASRAAPLGPTSAEVVIATFFNFNPALVRAAIPEAWGRAAPDAVLDARLRAVDRGLRRMLGDRLADPEIVRAAELARRAADGCRPEGRPLFAAHLGLGWPEQPHLALWHAVTLLREYRGDGHIAALVCAGLDACEAHVLHGISGEIDTAVLRATRAWADDEWDAAVGRLQERGWIDADGQLTEDGRSRRAEIERLTDDLAAGPWAMLDEDECEELRQTGKSLSRALIAAGALHRSR